MEGMADHQQNDINNNGDVNVLAAPLENNGGLQGAVQADLPQDPHQKDPRLRLTKEERENALLIKRAVEAVPELDNLPDLWYAQLSIFHMSDWFSIPVEENMEVILYAVHHLQIFRQEHRIVDNWNSGQRIMQQCIDFFPGKYLALSYSEKLGDYTLVVDASKLRKSVYKANPVAFDIYLQSIYFLMQAANPDIEAMRRGLFCITECEGFDWREAFGVTQMRRIWDEICSVYPVLIQRIEHIHTGVLINTIISLVKRFVRPEIVDKFEMGSWSEVARLDEMYLTPSLQAANKRLLDEVAESLHRRYTNEATFSL